MRRFLMLVVFLTLSLGWSLNRGHAQDVGTEIRGAWGNISTALQQLEVEREVLSRVETKLSEENEELLAKIEELQSAMAEATVAPETTLTLLQSCLSELQRLRWEEATEKAVLEELSKEGAVPLAPVADLKIKELESQIKITVVQIEQARAEIEKFELLYKKGSISSSEMDRKKALIQELETKLQSTQETLAVQQTIADAERKQPLTETTRRLAQLVLRHKLLDEELGELRKEYQRSADAKRKEWQLTLLQKRAELLQEKLMPLQTRKLQVEALIDHYRESMKKPNE